MRIFDVFELMFRGFIMLGSVCKHIHEKKYEATIVASCN